jgi:hypothetical protein
MLLEPGPCDHDTAATAGAGELAGSTTAGMGVSTSPPLLLFSLATTLLSCVGLGASLDPLDSLFTSPAKSDWDRVGAVQVGDAHRTPVKLLTWNPFFAHRRHFLPVRSRARRLALMAPWFALGLILGADTGTLMPLTPSLRTPNVSRVVLPRDRHWWETTYTRIFFLGPGLPRGLGTPSMVRLEAFRFMPGLGPGMPLRLSGLGGGASRLDDGVAAAVDGLLDSTGLTTAEGVASLLVEFDGDDGSTASCGNFFSSCLDRRSLMILLGIVAVFFACLVAWVMLMTAMPVSEVEGKNHFWWWLIRLGLAELSTQRQTWLAFALSPLAFVVGFRIWTGLTRPVSCQRHSTPIFSGREEEEWMQRDSICADWAAGLLGCWC